MNFSQLSYRKEQLLRLVFAFSLILSIFSISAPVALSNIQQQKTSTEFPWVKKDQISSRTLKYSIKQVLNTSVNDCVSIGKLPLEAILIYNLEQEVKFIHFTNLFKIIKTTIIIKLIFNNHLITSDQDDLI
jgi:hypothetical protein